MSSTPLLRQAPSVAARAGIGEVMLGWICNPIYSDSSRQWAERRWLRSAQGALVERCPGADPGADLGVSQE
jgi:hypothetical protein